MKALEIAIKELKHVLHKKENSAHRTDWMENKRLEDITELKHYIAELEAKTNFITLLDLFSPTIFNSVAELDDKIKEFGIELHGRSSAVEKLRTFAGNMYRKQNAKSALYYLKMKHLVGRELDLFIGVDQFEHVKDNFYTWSNGNINALFV